MDGIIRMATGDDAAAVTALRPLDVQGLPVHAQLLNHHRRGRTVGGHVGRIDDRPDDFGTGTE